MKTVGINERDQIGIERSVLSVFFFFTIVLIVVTLKGGWPIWLVLVHGVSWLLSIVVHTMRIKDYGFRACFTAAMQQLSFVLWALYAKDLFAIMPIFAAAVVTLGLYGIPELIYITFVAFSFLLFYHGLVIQTITVSSGAVLSQMIAQVLAVYLIEYIIFFLIRKRLEGSVRQHEIIANLKKAERSKDDFMANVSHEIRTPINTICGMSEIILRERLSDEVRRDVFSIQAAGRNLLSVVSDVLDFSELQSGKLELVEEAYNITSTLNDIINMSMARKNEKHIELIVDCAANIPGSLVGDEQKLRRVIMNMVNNAIKFTEEGCVSIIITCRPTSYGINLSVKVKDTGIGMKEESVERLFNTFNQVDTRRNRQEGGVGLGLAISRALVDAMGGFITVHSEIDKGSEFQFVIPQRVLNDTPIATIRDPDQLNVAVYIDMEKYDRVEIRDEYSYCIRHMVEQLPVKSHICHNLAELKRRVEREIYTHIFISIDEYEEGRLFFEKMAKVTKVIIVLDREDEYRVENPDVQLLYKPFFILPVVMTLNNEKVVQGMGEDHYHNGRFIAPDAHILVVDDNLMNIRVLEGLLRPYKIKVSMAMSGMEALDKIENMDYDFVFMDHMMPEMDGIETMHRIRQKPGRYFKKVPIIALTANAIGGMREIFLSEGFQDFVAKPIEISVLERVLKRNIPIEKQIRVYDEEDTLSAEGESLPQASEGALSQASGDSAAQASGEFSTQDKGESSQAPLQNGGMEAQLELPPERFDVATGIRYCGSRQDYIEIVRMHFKDGEENKKKIEQYFEQQDWPNYTILVHALKSSMLSIGVARLSDMAKKLEHAGKTGDTGYIMEHQQEMLEEYTKVLSDMEASKAINQPAEEDDISGREVLDEEQFDRLAAEFEEAAYSFDGEKLAEILGRLQQCSYRGYGLKELLEPVERKVEMTDYVSAADVVMKLKEKPAKQ